MLLDPRGCWCFQPPPRGTQCTAAKLQTSAAHQSSAAKRTLRSMGPRLDSRIHRRRHVMASVNIAARNEFCFGAAAQPPPLRGPPPPPHRMNFASRARRRGNDGTHAYTWHGTRVTTAHEENISSLSAPTAPGPGAKQPLDWMAALCGGSRGDRLFGGGC